MSRRFGVFILSHGRASRVLSYRALRKCGYTGPIWIVCDNEDKQLEEYKAIYGDEVLVFDKTSFARSVDACDNLDRRNSVVYARNYNFIFARELGVTHFLQLDDDYTSFAWIDYSEGKKEFVLRSLDLVFNLFCDFLDSTEAKTIAFCQGGDLIGGADSEMSHLDKAGSFKRKAMNSFFFRTDRPVKFVGRGNDDVNTYVRGGIVGDVFITHPRIRLYQPQTQTQAGGLTEMYLESGTYAKSFYSVMVAPSCVEIRGMGHKHRRLHHRVDWASACPVILDPKYRKEPGS